MGSWTTPANLATGQVVPESWTDAVNAAVDMAGKSRPMARVCRLAGAIGISGGTPADCTKVNLSSVLLDNDGMAVNGGLTINTPGAWYVETRVQWPANGGTGFRSLVLFESVNGTSLDSDSDDGHTNRATYLRCGVLNHFDVGNLLECRVAQSSGAPITLVAANWACYMLAILVAQ